MVDYAKQISSHTIIPNTKKVFLKNFLMVIMIALGIIALFLYLHWIVGIDVLLYPLEVFNIFVDVKLVIIYFISGVAGLSLLLGILNYFAVKGIRYTFYKDMLRLERTASFVLLDSVDIPYKNVFKVDYDNDGFFNTIFNSGTVVLELNHMKKKVEKLMFIDNAQEVALYIQNIIKKIKQMEQAKFDEDNKISGIMEGL
jgi:hypothetical protein|tara:strand:+ start:630 stop:1226 length:597 start_codon:yes stop_codon:yes gene_type:complete